MSRNISIIVLLVIIGIIGVLFYKVMAGFFVPLFLAALLVVIFRPFHERVSQRLGNRPQLSALFTTIGILLIVLLPITLTLVVGALQGARMVSQFHLSVGSALTRARASLGLEAPYIDQVQRVDESMQKLLDSESRESDPAGLLKTTHGVTVAVTELTNVAKQSDEGKAAVPMLDPMVETLQELEKQLTAEVQGKSEAAVNELEPAIDLRLRVSTQWTAIRRNMLGGPVRAELIQLAHPSREQMGKWLTEVQPMLLSVTSATGAAVGRLVVGLCIMVISLYFFLVDGPKMVRSLMALSPLDDRYEAQLLMEFDRISRAVVLATILSAVAQGILASIGYLVTGFSSVMLLMLITTVMAMIPFLGAAAVWIPCAVYLGVVEGRVGAAIGLAIYGAVVVSSIDNVIKAFILHGRSRLHPLLALLSVLGGVMVFGPIGILIGPMVVVFLQTSLEILNRELAEGHLHQRHVDHRGRSREGQRLRAAMGQRTMHPD